MKHTHVAAGLIALGLFGCAAKKHLTADQYFHEASNNFRGGAFTLAIDQFHELLDQYPFSQYNEEAEMRIAHAHYLLGRYAEAIAAFTDFQRRHPTSPQLPFVGYYLGMCYAKQLGTVDRDQAAAQNAQNVFLTVIQQYPDSPFAELARQQLARCRRNLAEHELYIANYYAKRGNDKAAEIRLLTLAARYGDTDASADGLLRLAKMYRRDKQDREAVLAYRALEQLHPRSTQSAVAERALDRLAKVDPPPDGDALDILLAANGRQRSSGKLEVVMGMRHRPSAAAGPGFVPPMDPFSRGGGTGFPY
jgi:outer membrane protein assembly factor BamD